MQRLESLPGQENTIITPILQSLHWLPIKFRISYKTLLLTYKALNGLAPAYLTSLQSHYNPSHSLRSQISGLLVVPRIAKSTKGGRAFSHLSPKLWNSLFAARVTCWYTRSRVNHKLWVDTQDTRWTWSKPGWICLVVPLLNLLWNSEFIKIMTKSIAEFSNKIMVNLVKCIL